MEQFINWITENILLVAIIAGVVLVLVIVCIILATKSKKAKTATVEDSTATTTATDNNDEVEVIEVDDSKPATATPQKEVTNIYHITLRAKDDKWQVKKQNSSKAMKLFDTQLEAINYAKTLAKSNNGSIRVHKVTGQIRKV